MKIWVKTKEYSEGKFLVLRRDGTKPDWPHFVMGARDPAVPRALEIYGQVAEGLGFDPEYVESVKELAQDFRRYRTESGSGDPDAAPHRVDDVVMLKLMRGDITFSEIITALRWYADENRYDYDEDCCADGRNPARKEAGAGALDDRGERARNILKV